MWQPKMTISNVNILDKFWASSSIYRIDLKHLKDGLFVFIRNKKDWTDMNID